VRQWQGKRYWLVGASEGLGRSVAIQLSKLGVEVILSARSEDRLTALAAELPGKSQVVPVDISDMASVKAAAAAVGEIDGVVFLAGVYWPQSAQNWNPDEVEMMCDVNFTGAARVVGNVIGPMVARDNGHIVLTGSLSAFRGLPGAIGYAASKGGVRALAESMECDLRGSGVQVQIINPGYIKTRLTDKNTHAMPFIMEPDDAAREMVEFMGTDRFKKSFPRAFSLFFRASQFFPDWLYYKVFGSGGK
jgi:NADP-dependent 3-hydroxy acid dehydrogenase YdfG